MPIAALQKRVNTGGDPRMGSIVDAHAAKALQTKRLPNWKQYSAKMHKQSANHARDLLGISSLGAPVPIEEVESITCYSQSVS